MSNAAVEASGTVAAARTEDAVKIYGSGEIEVRALSGVNIAFEQGQFTAIMGPSGSGKSTLLHCMAALDDLTEGRAFIGDTDLGTLTDRELTRLRRERVGFIFQAFNLVP
ncbi:MAG: ATP-binding cassette domain-containing protein, partial [Acidimicrobiaceae bacterium]|nr:ATP-binding cassette domain-containing protein [Acidimicrobiaceae bacterium]